MLTKLYVRATTALRREEGATATEYGLLVAFIAFAIIIGVTVFGNALSAYFSTLGTTVADWNP